MSKIYVTPLQLPSIVSFFFLLVLPVGLWCHCIRESAAVLPPFESHEDKYLDFTEVPN
jgi:hypothetical protein